jgi:tetratricopeptide (TPR) repeat protein
MKRILPFLLSLITFASLSQDILKVDSLLNSVNRDDSAQVHRVVDALNLAKKIEYEKGEAKAYLYLGYIYCVKRNFPLSMEKYMYADELYKSIGDDEMRAKACIGMAYTFHEMKSPEKVIHYAKLVLKLSKQDSLKAYAYNSIGRGQMALGRTDSAFNSFMTAVKLAEKSGKVKNVHLFFTGLGNAYIKVKMYDSAIVSFWKIQRYANGDTKQLAWMYNNIGVCHHFKKEYQYAELNYLESIALGVKSESGGACLNYAELLHETGNEEKARAYLAKGLQFDYDLGHLGRTLFEMQLFKESSMVRDCLYIHATRDFEQLRSECVTVAAIESDLRNAREKAALKEASDWKGKMLITLLLVGLVFVGVVIKYGVDFYRRSKNAEKTFKDLRLILKKAIDSIQSS